MLFGAQGLRLPGATLGEGVGAHQAGPHGPFGLAGKLTAVQILGGGTAQEPDLACGGFGRHPCPHPQSPKSRGVRAPGGAGAAGELLANASSSICLWQSVLMPADYPHAVP